MTHRSEVPVASSGARKDLVSLSFTALGPQFCRFQWCCAGETGVGANEGDFRFLTIPCKVLISG